MRKQNIKTRLVGAVCIVMLVLHALCLGSLAEDKKPVENYLKSGDPIRNVIVYDLFGESTPITDITKEKTSVLFYVRSTCRDCRAEFPNYKEFVSKSQSHEDYNVIFLWDGEIPFDDLKTLNIPDEINYSNRKEYKLNSWVPTYFVIDKNSVVIYKSINFSSLLEFFNNYN